MMKKIKLTKVITSALVISSVIALSPIGASAEWKSNSSGWRYANGGLWYTGWKQIDGNWYYFRQDGYMAHNTSIDGCRLGTDGAWIQNIAGIYYIGTDLVPMNFKSTKYGGGYKYSNRNEWVSGETITDNLNNKYDNFLTLWCWSGDGKYQELNDVYTEIPLQKQFTKFKSKVGLTNSHQNELKSADVKIYLDDKVAYSKNFKSGDMLDNIELDLTGTTKMKFAIENIKSGSETGSGEELGLFDLQFIK